MIIAMKKAVALSLLCLSSFYISAQSRQSQFGEKLKLGFNLSITHSNLIADFEANQNISVKNGFAHRVGLLADYQMTNTLFLSPEIAISSASGEIYFDQLTGFRGGIYLTNVTFDFTAHVKIHDKFKDWSGYFLVGPNIRVPAVKKESHQFVAQTTTTDVAIDFGVGVNKIMKKVRLSPELRYTMGLVDINDHPDLKSLYFHNISLVFNLVGV